MKHLQTALLALSVASSLLACSSPPATTPPATNTGSLLVNVGGLPNGLNANVLVSGPEGFQQSLTGTKVLNDLKAGTYTVTAQAVRQAGSMIDTMLEAGGGNATVTAGASALSVNYAPRPGTGQLWLPLENAQVHGFTAAALGATGTPISSTVLGISGGTTLDALAFDADGSMWIADSGNGAIHKISMQGSSATLKPNVTITANTGSLETPSGLAFDKDGSLWVVNRNPKTIVKFGKAQLNASGNPAPDVTIGANAGSLNNPSAIAFDKDGGLWVTNLSPTSSVVKFGAAQLASSGNPIPSVTISSNANSLVFPSALAFDANGNLWVSNFALNTLVKFSSANLNASGNPLPTVTIAANAGSISSPSGMAFDAGGNLWLANIGPHNLVQFTASQIGSSGNPAPNVTVSTGAFKGGGLAFNPAPVNLPIAQTK